MITLKRQGKKYQIDETDQQRIRELSFLFGGDIQAAIEQHWQEKFGAADGTYRIIEVTEGSNVTIDREAK